MPNLIATTFLLTTVTAIPHTPSFHVEASPAANAKTHFLHDAFTPITTAEGLPDAVKATIAPAHGDVETVLGNPGSKINTTDFNIDPNRPFARLIFAGSNVDYAFIYKESGGITHGMTVEMFYIHAGTSQMVWSTPASGMNLEQLRKSIELAAGG